jgi:hypothetical protein
MKMVLNQSCKESYKRAVSVKESNSGERASEGYTNIK